jgi:DNA-binding LacI/PurR family transcriptional regulator
VGQKTLDKALTVWYNETGLIKPVSSTFSEERMAARRSVTIRDVAREAGVSPGTVSRAINDSPLVNVETRERIMRVVRELDYVPHLAARRLSIGKTLTIAVIVPFFYRPSVSERLKGVVSALSQSQYDLLIHNIETPQQRDMGFQDILRADRVDGALLVSLPVPDRYVAQLSTADVPVVLIDTSHPALMMFSRVKVDDVAGGQLATEYLIELGHTEIGFVGDIVDTPFHFTSSRDRHSGYCRALRSAGLSLRPEYYQESEHGRLRARENARAMLSLRNRPTAIFAASDTQAVGVLEAAREAGLPVPEALSVIGYDDIELSDILGLSTIRQLLFESGQRGAELLLEALGDAQTAPTHEVLPIELVARETTAAPLS